MYQVINRWLIQFELDQMRDLLMVLGESLRDYEAKLENRSFSDEEYDSDEFERYIDLIGSVIGDFPRRIYSNFLVSWYSFVEDSLTKLCIDLDLTIPMRFHDEHRFGAEILRAKKFLEMAEGVSFENSNWQELEYIRRIRNQVVHKGGRFQTSSEKPESREVVQAEMDKQIVYIHVDRSLFDYITKHSLGHYYGTFFINPTQEYCYHLINFAQDFFNHILDELGL